MTFARDTTAANIKPLEGAIVRRYTAGETIAAGEVVSMPSGGKVVAAEGDDITEAIVMGIALAAALVNERVDVVVHGPVVCLSGATAANLVYITDTPGEPAATASATKDTLVGIAESATVLFVRPQPIHLS